MRRGKRRRRRSRWKKNRNQGNNKQDGRENECHIVVSEKLLTFLALMKDAIPYCSTYTSIYIYNNTIYTIISHFSSIESVLRDDNESPLKE